MGIEKVETPLNNEQTLRLINVANIEDKVVSASMVQVGYIKKFEVKYESFNGDIFLREDDINFIMNGITLERD